MILAVILLIAPSCTQDSRNDSEMIVADNTLLINPSEAQKVNYSQVFSKVDYIPIPTDEDFLIGDVDKLIVTDSHILMMDKYISHSVFIFDKSGTEKIQLSKLGNAPGEYVVMQDIFFDSEKQELVIYCNIRKKLLCYNVNGKFIREESIPFRGWRVKPVGNNYAIFSDYIFNDNAKKSKKYPNIILSSLSENIISSADFFTEDVDTKIVWSSVPDFSETTDKSVSIKPDHGNIVYHITADSIYPAYRLDFGKYNIDARYWEKATEKGVTLKRVNEYCNALGLCESYNLLEDSDYLYFNYKQKEKANTVFYSKKTNKMVHANAFLNDMDQITAFHPKLLYDKKIYCLLKAEDILLAKTFLAQNKLLPPEILDNTQEFDNPVIVIFTLKDF
ncbi:hypothetical protein FACS1894176_08440 [Bacteroidia bacterium]|nr:hypothetical protein FACS1894176_08440 [Bacteroidia bacterium]